MKHFCLECGTELELKWTTHADYSWSGKTEELYLCNECLSSWEIIEQENGKFDIQRYFFG